MQLPKTVETSRHDAAIIGGGVVGCAVARKLTLLGAQVVLVEKAPDILAGASKGNSAILHTGFDAPTGSLELNCMKAGYAEYIEIRDRLGLPMLETGAVVVAWNEAELQALDAIEAKALANGVDRTRYLSAAEILSREPQLSPELLGGLLIPDEHIIDPWSTPLGYIHQALANGAAVMRETELISGEFDGQRWALKTNRGEVLATIVINCAGLFGDIVDERLTGRSFFKIKPRKGQFVVYDKIAAQLLKTIVLPVPTERTKGIVLAPTIFGNLLVGPTAEEQEDRGHATVDTQMLEGLITKAETLLPALKTVPVTATYAGLRPATESKEYQFRHEAAMNLITVGGVRSTGLTAALGIAQHVAQAYEQSGQPVKRLNAPVWPIMPSLAEHEPRDWTQPGYGEIICHCELVTRREIEAALSGPLPAGDYSGLKRRTRAGMGRCQGFYCGAQIAAMTKGRFSVPLSLSEAADRYD